MLLMILMEKKLLELFTKNNCKKYIKKARIRKIIKKKRDKLYVKWKGYNNSLSSWIDKTKEEYK